MWRERALKILLVVLGLLFVAGLYPLAMFWREDPSLAMMLSVYVTLGVFLLMASPDPWAHRSLIGFTAWSSFAHGAVMAVQGLHNNPASGIGGRGCTHSRGIDADRVHSGEATTRAGSRGVEVDRSSGGS